MKKLVLDTSVLLKWFVMEDDWRLAREILSDYQKGKVKIYLPELVKYELGNALLKGKGLLWSEVKDGLKYFWGLGLNFVVSDLKLAGETYKIAEKLRITYYDAVFLALAKREKAVLVTANPKHQRKIQGVKVESL